MLHSLKIFIKEMCCSVSYRLLSMLLLMGYVIDLTVLTQLTSAGYLRLEAAIQYVCRSFQGVDVERMWKLTSEVRKVKNSHEYFCFLVAAILFSVLPPHEI